MFRTALATPTFLAGLTVLAWLTPSTAMAQLPDAPSAVRAGLIGLSVPHPAKAGDADVFVTAWRPVLLASNAEPVDGYQQPLYKPVKQNAGSDVSSSILETRPVPGVAPDLRNACPKSACPLAKEVMCCGAGPTLSPFARYLRSPDAVPMTARDNLHSAVRHVIDPFNLMTIVADAAIGVASDSHSVYGPGFDGFSKYTGVSLTEDMTGEFFGTFLIPSIMHQDPHYHREPFVPVQRRILHAITQVVWTQSYTGQPMFNYANIVGGVATAVVSNTFVPGPNRQGFSNTAQRLAIAFAISPSGNLITEFVPDFARRINLRVVIFQRILNSVTLEESGVQ